MNSKILLLSIAVISVGLFAMPSTLSLFAGQHTFDAGSDVRCQKCHQDIYDALQGNSFHKNTTGAPSYADQLGYCVSCHRVNETGLTLTNIPLGNGTNGGVDLNRSSVNASHTQVLTLECTTCHYKVPTNITNDAEAHKPYYESAVGGTNGTGNKTAAVPLKGANAACLGCHTHTVVTINWTRSAGYNMTVSESDSGAYTIAFAVNTTKNTSVITSSS